MIPYNFKFKRQCYWFLSFFKNSFNKQAWLKEKYNLDRIY